MSEARPVLAVSPIAQRLARLDAMLETHVWLWRYEPYKLEQPSWCASRPRLAADLLRLDDAEVDRLTADGGALVGLIARSIPSVGDLPALLELPQSECHRLPAAGPHAMRDVPGRKAAQIECFAAAIRHAGAPLVEWCAGKGHLGRRLALATDRAVTSLEIDARLCEQGRVLAQRAGARSQRFVTVDVLGPFAHGRLREHQAVALHACGDLHGALLRRAVEEGATAVYLAPCCYHKSADAAQPWSGETRLVPTRDELRLSVSDAVTAAPREIRARRQQAAWLLGLRTIAGEMRETMPKASGAGATFREYCEQTAAQSGVALPPGIDWTRAEREAFALEQRVRRLALPRLAFRRALELWLAFGRARRLEQHGYHVSVSTFCARALTPRNVLIAAER